MKNKLLIILLVITTQCITAKSQVAFKANCGLSYINHFSVGTTINFKDKHNISALFGSNVFVNMQDFASYMLQYEYVSTGSSFAGLNPKCGVKTGYSIFTDKYYQWELIQAVPYIGCNYPINDKLDLGLDLGLSVSKALSIMRIKTGELGWYKRYNPELKLSIIYRLKR